MSEAVQKELPGNWMPGQIKDLVTIRNGYAFKSKDFKDEGDVPVIRQTNLSTRIVNFNKPKYLPAEFLDEFESYRINKGDVLIGLSGSIGNLSRYLLDEPALQNQRTGLLVEHVPGSIKYVEYYLQLIKEQLLDAAKGVAVQNISSKTIESWNIPLAPPEQQKRIVAKIEELFSHIDAGIEALKKAKQLLKQYRQSVLKAAVTGELTKEWRDENGVFFDKTWQSLEFGDVVEIIDPNPSHRYPPYDDGDVPLMATKQMVGEDDWDESTAKLTTSEFYEQRKASHGFKSDDIIFARKGRLGLARRPPKISRYAFSHTIFIMRGNADIHSEYLLWFLRREDAISWLLREMNVAAGVPTLGKAILGKLPLLLPTKNEQKIIAEKIEEKITAVQRMAENIDLQLMKAEKNKQAILASAFAGDI